MEQLKLCFSDCGFILIACFGALLIVVLAFLAAGSSDDKTDRKDS